MHVSGARPSNQSTLHGEAAGSWHVTETVQTRWEGSMRQGACRKVTSFGHLESCNMLLMLPGCCSEMQIPVFCCSHKVQMCTLGLKCSTFGFATIIVCSSAVSRYGSKREVGGVVIRCTRRACRASASAGFGYAARSLRSPFWVPLGRPEGPTGTLVSGVGTRTLFMCPCTRLYLFPLTLSLPHC